ncbi:hypothetical protein [Roseinatronobacter alkalisoli]|uniref:Uncharacterized protein n=1 Tax=Roseinatronobacter alkalisoli TaxID=3028235 RepID=A0ABT5TEK1_9RHOB|nr:hypothetical protein [Roseinatronobacter sp. HJB301]MDD7972811.1 hypothetical protein [Roseinatronobacter sp. HJB301]
MVRLSSVQCYNITIIYANGLQALSLILPGHVPVMPGTTVLCGVLSDLPMADVAGVSGSWLGPGSGANAAKVQRIRNCGDDLFADMLTSSGQ